MLKMARLLYSKCICQTHMQKLRPEIETYTTYTERTHKVGERGGVERCASSFTQTHTQRWGDSLTDLCIGSQLACLSVKHWADLFPRT